VRQPRLLTGLLLLAAIGLIISGCTIKSPETPSWETTWDMPLTNKAYSIEDIVDKLDTDEIVFDSLGNPNFSIIQQVDTTAVENSLTADATSNTYDDSLDVVDIDAPTVSPAVIPFDDLNLPVVADAIPVDTAFTHTDGLADFDNFDWAAISEGILEIEAVNDLGIDIDSLVINIYNTSDLSTPIGIAIFEDGVLDGQTLSRQVDLAGQFMEKSISYISHGIVLTQSLNLPTGDLTINGSFPSGLSVSSAYAEIPEFNKDMDQTVELTDESIIHEAIIATGSLSIEIVNGSALPMAIDLSVPSFVYNNSSLTITGNINGNSIFNREVDLAGYSFYPTGTTFPQTITVNVVATITDTAPVKYQVNATDSLMVISEVSEITFESVMGRIKPTDVDIEPIVQEVEMPEGFENAQLTHAQMKMTLYNNSNSDMYIDILLENEDQSKSVVAQDTARGKSALATEAQATEIILTSLVLSDFLDPTPQEIRISGVATMNPANLDSVEIHSDDFFYGDVEIYSPLAFALADTSVMDMDITEAEVGGEDSPDFGETIDYAVIQVEAASHLPVGVYVELYLGTRNDDAIFTDPNSVIVGRFYLESAETDEDGFAIEEVSMEFEDSLTSEEVAIFNNEIVYIAPRIGLLPTGDNGSYILGSDYINITSTARVRVNADDNLWDDDDEN